MIREQDLQSGPVLQQLGGRIIIPFIGVKETPGTPIHKAIYRGPITPFTTSMGPLCRFLRSTSKDQFWKQ